MTAEDRAFKKILAEQVQERLSVTAEGILVEQVQELCAQLSDIHHQLERIADHLENSEGNG